MGGSGCGGIEWVGATTATMTTTEMWTGERRQQNRENRRQSRYNNNSGTNSSRECGRGTQHY